MPGLEWLDPTGMREREPELAGSAALFSPTTAIVDYPAVARALATDVEQAGGRARHRRAGLRASPGARRRLRVAAGAGPASPSDHLVVCAGLQSDRVARCSPETAPSPAIIPFRGEYLRLRPDVRDRVRHLIYPVPDPAYPFLGVH